MTDTQNYPSSRYARALLKQKPVWEEDKEFTQLMRAIEFTPVTIPRCYFLYQAAQQTATLPGDIAEVGVYRGGTARILTETSRPFAKSVHLFDTFEGMPAVDRSKDIHREGDFADTSVAAVKKQLGELTNYVIHKGIFPATAGEVAGELFSLVHIDVDIYRSVLDCCEFFYPRVAVSGLLVFDDYGSESCPGAKMAVDEFFRDRPETPMYLPTGQCLVIKKQGAGN